MSDQPGGAAGSDNEQPRDSDVDADADRDARASPSDESIFGTDSGSVFDEESESEPKSADADAAIPAEDSIFGRSDGSPFDVGSADANASTDTDADSTDAAPGADADADADSAASNADSTDADERDDSSADGSLEKVDADAEAGDGESPEAKADGEGYVGDRPEQEEPSYPDPDDDVGGISTPPDDEEMPLADHIEEMILRLAVVVLVGSAGTAIGLLGATEAIDLIWTHIFPYAAEEVPRPHVYGPLELWLTRIKVAALLGIIMALPMLVYETYLFMRPGLYPNERRYYLAAVPSSIVLGLIGMAFSFALVLPVLFQYFTVYAQGNADIAYALGETFNLIITLTAFLAIVFQIPLFIMLAIMMGVTTRQWLASKRLYFWAAFFGLSFMFTMDPTMMAPILVAIVMIVLFEGTLLLLKWTGRE